MLMRYYSVVHATNIRNRNRERRKTQKRSALNFYCLRKLSKWLLSAIRGVSKIWISSSLILKADGNSGFTLERVDLQACTQA